MLAKALLLCAILCFGWAVVATAWLGDDCMITLRVVENLVAGHGPRWNVGDRVQVGSHPLWVLVLAVARVALGSSAAAVWLASGLCTAAAMGLLLRCCGAPRPAALLSFALTTSTAFIDYATSGLENPLAHLLLVLFALAVLAPSGPAPLPLGLCASGLLLTRIDLLPLVLPVLPAAARGRSLRAWLPALALGLLPLLGWLLFASLYYGSPLPVVAYSKALSTGIPRLGFVGQGLRYLAHLAVSDPATLLLLLAGLSALGFRPPPAGRWLLAGLLLQFVYVVYVGGDFMAGRFYTPLLAAALVPLALRLRRGLPDRVVLPALLLLACAFLFAGRLPALLGRPPAKPLPAPEQPDGIGDERAFYYAQFGLLAAGRQPLQPGAYSELLRRNGRSRPVVAVAYAVGAQSLLAGELVHVVDPLLCDPLLARLPVRPGTAWHPGHIPRRIPEGYLESLAHGDNRIVHPGLRRYWEALRRVIAAPVFDRQRLATLVAFWRGDFAADLADYVATDYQRPPLVAVDARALATAPADGTAWYDCEARVVLEGGLEVRFPAPPQGTALRLSLDGGDRYRVAFWRGDRCLGERAVDGPRPAHGGLGTASIRLDEALQGFDRVTVLAAPGADFVAAVAAVAAVP